MYAIERKDDFITDNSILDRLRVGAEPTRARLQKHVLVFWRKENKIIRNDVNTYQKTT